MAIPRHPDGSVDLPGALEAVRAVAARLHEHVRETPTVYSYTFSESTGCDVFLKLENLQRTGSFKVRGALAKMFALTPAERGRGVVAASAGNHAQGVALAARLAGTEATIVMPRDTPLIKVRRTEGYGANVVLAGDNYDEAQELARDLERERGLTLLHAFDDADVILGQATIGLEILAQVQDLNAVLVPVGGGGLIAGIALVIKALAPEVSVIGVQAAGADAMAQSFRSGQRVTLERTQTMADGIRVARPGALTFELVRALVDDVVTVDEEAISSAVVEMLEKSKVVAEAGAVVSVAAIASGKIAARGNLCAVLSAGNIDLNFLGRLIESGLAQQGFYHPLLIRLPDRPGQLQSVLAVLAQTESNVVNVQHYRSGWRIPVGFVDVEILVETRRANLGPDIDALLVARGFQLEPTGERA